MNRLLVIMAAGAGCVFGASLCPAGYTGMTSGEVSATVQVEAGLAGGTGSSATWGRPVDGGPVFEQELHEYAQWTSHDPTWDHAYADARALLTGSQTMRSAGLLYSLSYWVSLYHMGPGAMADARGTLTVVYRVDDPAQGFLQVEVTQGRAVLTDLLSGQVVQDSVSGFVFDGALGQGLYRLDVVAEYTGTFEALISIPGNGPFALLGLAGLAIGVRGRRARLERW